MSEDADFQVIREAWEAGSREDDDELARYLHEEIEIVPFGAAMEGRSYRGRDGVRHWLESEVRANWDYFRTIPEHFERVGDKILVTGHWEARGKGSGIELERPATWVMKMRDGKIVYWQTYTDRDEALRDVGLADS